MACAPRTGGFLTYMAMAGEEALSASAAFPPEQEGSQIKKKRLKQALEVPVP
jgi:hypothetical protein